MKNILHIILISFFCLTFISCAKESGSSSSSTTTTTMSTPSIADGNYKITSIVVGLYLSDGTHYSTTTYSISHDSSVTPGYSGFVMAWQGSGVYRITVFGKSTASSTGLSDSTLDCSTNDITNYTLDTDGNATGVTPIQTGCGGQSSSLTTVSIKFSVISGGMTKYVVMEDSYSQQYRYTYTALKQ